MSATPRPQEPDWLDDYVDSMLLRCEWRYFVKQLVGALITDLVPRRVAVAHVLRGRLNDIRRYQPPFNMDDLDLSPLSHRQVL